MKRLFYIIFAFAVALPPLMAAAQSPQPPRHLVYSFNIGDQGSQHVTDASGANGNGSANYGGGVTDRGQITVDVLGVEADQGVVVKVSEAAIDTRSTKPATCVVYPNTNVLCAADAVVNPEESAIIRLLSPQFVDLTKVDSKQHWQIDGSSGSTSRLMDFTIAKNNAGVMQINEDAEMKVAGATPMTSSTQNQVSYDANRDLPLSIKEYTTTRSQTPDGYVTEIVQIDANLISDSRAPQ